jgi:hypothetical protein
MFRSRRARSHRDAEQPEIDRYKISRASFLKPWDSPASSKTALHHLHIPSTQHHKMSHPLLGRKQTPQSPCPDWHSIVVSPCWLASVSPASYEGDYWLDPSRKLSNESR